MRMEYPELNTPADSPQPSADRPAALRVIDANLNRGGEALRVVEDTLRFVIADSHLQNIGKMLRHELGILASRLQEQTRLIGVRDAAGDVGRSTEHADEYLRANVDQILRANFVRASQSLRSLEEFCKLIDPSAAVQAEEIRYRVYELEKAVLQTLASQQRLTGVRLCVIVDGGAHTDGFQKLIHEAIAGGAGMIQLRDKSLGDRPLVERSRCLVDVCQKYGAVTIINDRTDIALACGADGVHLGQDDLSPADARRIGGPDLIIGVSTHDLPQARQAVLDGANYIGVGPTFPSATKQFDEFTGTLLLESVAAEITLPAFAIGGINHENIDQVLDTGICRVAVAGGVFRSNSPVHQATAELAARLIERDSIDGATPHA